ILERTSLGGADQGRRKLVYDIRPIWINGGSMATEYKQHFMIDSIVIKQAIIVGAYGIGAKNIAQFHARSSHICFEIVPLHRNSAMCARHEDRIAGRLKDIVLDCHVMSRNRDAALTRQ